MRRKLLLLFIAVGTIVALFVIAKPSYIEISIFGLSLYLIYCNLWPNLEVNSKNQSKVKIDYLEIASITALSLITVALVVLGDQSTIAAGFANLWFYSFLMTSKRKDSGSPAYLFTLGSFVLILIALTSRTFYSLNLVSAFVNQGIIITVVPFVLGVIGIFISTEQLQKEQQDYVENKWTVEWFSILINLVSHNLKSPLAAISANAQLLQMKGADDRDFKVLKRIDSAVETSNEIIHRLLKASFLSDSMSNEGINSSLEKTYPGLQIEGILDLDLKYEESISIHLALEVFLDNAFKYSPKGVRISSENGSITIRDYGPGLSDEQLKSFGEVNENSSSTLHGIGIPFALKLLNSINYQVTPQNLKDGLMITIHKGQH